MEKKLQVKNIYALSPMQENMLFTSLLDNSSAAYFEQVSFTVTSVLDIKIFNESFKQLVQRYDILRTNFIHKQAGKPVQVVLKERFADIYYEDLTKLDGSTCNNYIKDFMEKDRQRGFDLAKDMLLRLSVLKTGDKSYKLLWSFHHILMDGWCIGIVIKDFLRIYECMENGRVPELESVRPYSEYISWLEKKDMGLSAAFWKEYLDGCDNQITLPGNIRGIEKKPYLKEEVFLNINRTATLELQEIARKNQGTLNTLIQCAWALLLRKYNNTDDVVFGTVVSGRPPEIAGIENMVGLFINTVPVRIKCYGHTRFCELIKEVQHSASASSSHEYFPLAQIQADSPLKNKLINHILAFENYPLDEELKGSSDESSNAQSMDEFQVFEQTSYDFNILVVPGNNLSIKFSYNANCYDRDSVNSIMGHLEKVLGEIVRDSNRRIAEIDILTKDEQYRILHDFNDTAVKYAEDKTLVRLFEEQAKKTPGNTALLFGCRSMTYGELNIKSNQLARLLADKGVGSNAIVAVMAERSFEMVIGILGILKAGGAYLPIDTGYPPERINFILEDSGAKLMLKQSQVEGNFKAECINLEDGAVYAGDGNNLERANKPDDLAYVIYTSGSTGKPKGVMIEHRSAVNILLDLQRRYPLNDKDTYLLKTTYTFDVSVAELFGWFHAGGRLAILDRDYEKEPDRILDAIDSYNVTHINFVPSMLNTFINSIGNSGQKVLEKLKYVFAAGEALPAKVVEKFCSSCHKVRLLNIYGPTEATIYATAFSLESFNGSAGVPIGKPMGNIRAYIVDSGGNLQPVGAAGELCLAGAGLARGYINSPEMTDKKFVDNPFYTGERMYRTGDLARWLPDGNIEFLGRIDNQVKIRGFRIELGEVETKISGYPGIKEVVVHPGQDKEGVSYLCAYYVSDSDISVHALREYLMSGLPEYMVPSYFMQLEKIPLNANGKVDRKRLPQPLENISSQNEYVAPADEIEQKLAEIWQDILGIQKIGINDNFFEIGGHSLKATVLAARLHKELNVELPLKQLFNAPTIRALAQYISKLKRSEYLSIEPVGKKEYYELSPSQKRMFILNQLESSKTTYNIPFAVLIEGRLDREKLENTFKVLTVRHEALRTSFLIINDQAVQKVADDLEPDIGYTACDITPDAAEEIKGLIASFIKPFDLGRAPLFRVGIVKICEDKHIMMLDMHHIISDGVSISIIFNEFVSLYNGLELAPLKIQYKDFSAWQNELVRGGRIKEQEEYWLDRFSGELPVINLPTDFPIPSVQSFEGERFSFQIEKGLASKAEKFAVDTGTTLYMILLAVYNILLSRYSGQEDIIVGSPASGRRHADLEKVVGMFVNTLAMRNFPLGDKTFKYFLEEVRENSLKAFENQDYQFEELVERLDMPRDISRNPLFDVMFAFQNIEFHQTDVKNIKVTPLNVESKVAKFFISLEAAKKADVINMDIEYCSRLFTRQRMEKMAGHFVNILEEIVNNPYMRLKDIDMLTVAEKAEILDKFNNTLAPYPKDTTIHGMFEKQAEKTPDSVAAVFGHSLLTYKELNEKSNSLARLLTLKGVKSGSIVGICIERSLEMIVGIMGILKAGGAYLPISPDYPQDRIKYMLSDSKALLLLTQKSYPEVTDYGLETINLEDESIYSFDLSNLSSVSKPSDLAYVIYTSGSTGNPKGVMIEHYSVINRLNWMQRNYPIGEGDTILQKTPFTFDVSVWEMFWWSFVGAKVCFLQPKGEKDPSLIVNSIKENNITTMHFVPSMLGVFLQYIEAAGAADRLKSLRQVFASGEALNAAQVEKFNKLIYPNNGTRLYNLYGPTEATVDVSYYNCPTDGQIDTVPIGKPIDNMRLYVVNKYDSLQPVGVAGELCIAGDGLARGYLNRTDLTLEKFVPNPFEQGTKMYRTGDLARWLPDGNIEYLGRLDHQVKIRGNRVELGEIEAGILAFGNIKETVVMARDDREGVKYLCAYITAAGQINMEDIRNYLSASLPEYMIPAYFVELEEMPLTQSGKVDRKALPEPEGTVTGGTPFQAPGNGFEARLVKIWKDILGTEHIGVNDDFFLIGGHSLKAAVLAARIHKEFDVEIPLVEIFKLKTVKAIAEYLMSEEKSLYYSISPVEEMEYYAASSAQRRMYVLYVLGVGDTSYNVSTAAILEGRLDKRRLEAAFRTLLQRHEALRTSFRMVEGELVQVINDVEFNYMEEPLKEYFHIEYIKADRPLELVAGKPENKQAVNSYIKNFIRPFDLGTAPLFRVGLVEFPGSRYVLMLDMHHIISDGASINILIREFISLYSNAALPELPIQYKDFARWHNELLKTEKVKKQESYWLNRFSGEVPLLKFPTDFERLEDNNHEGGFEYFTAGKEATLSIEEFMGKSGTTLFMLMLAAYYTLLMKYTGQEDIVVGSPVAGRNHQDLENVVGIFINMLALRNNPKKNKTFTEFLMEVKESVLEAFDNQDYQYEELVNRLGIYGVGGARPLFNTVFVLQNTEQLKVGEYGELRVMPYEQDIDKAGYDILLSASYSNDNICYQINYSTQLFKRETILTMGGHLLDILKQVADNPDIRLMNIKLMSQQDKRAELSVTAENYSAEKEKSTAVIEADFDF